MTQLFDKYCDSFVAGITVDTLKTIRDVDTFVKVVAEYSIIKCNLTKGVRESDCQSLPQVKAADAMKEFETRRMQGKFRAGFAGTPQQTKSYTRPPPRLNRLSGDDDDDDM